MSSRSGPRAESGLFSLSRICQRGDRRMASTTDQHNQATSSALERHGKLVCEAASKVFSALCGRPVQLTVDRMVPGSPSTLNPLLPGPCIGMTIRATQGLVGTQLLIWRASDAVTLAHLILGEEPASGAELSADCRDALSEAVNQISGSLGTAMRSALGRPVTFEAEAVADGGEAGACLAVFRDEAPAPWLCVARIMRDGSVSGEAVLVVSPSLLPDAEQVQTDNDSVTAKEGAVSATSASTHSPFVPLSGGEQRVGSTNGIDMLLDVNLQVSVELGRTRLQIREILQLGPGSIVELDKQAGDAVDILVNDKPIAKGEVIIIDENFGVRLTSITSVADRIKNLR
ncbi:MAG: flagellar motor switch protein FliN [candidate division NC10 bacterium]|nr:flagellar motor switch protein FliN [candidate division NC10 bacterium]